MAGHANYRITLDALLATIEAGGSYQMDTGTYRMDRATDPANHDHAPFQAEDAVYYIPREPTSVYPHWFAVRVRYADLASPWHATGAGYVLFTQAANGAVWKNALEPYLLTGSGPAPLVETDAEGYATEASLTGNDPNLRVPPWQMQGVTAASLDGAPDIVKNPGNLADLQDEGYFQPRLPHGSTDIDGYYVSEVWAVAIHPQMCPRNAIASSLMSLMRFGKREASRLWGAELCRNG